MSARVRRWLARYLTYPHVPCCDHHDRLARERIGTGWR